MFEIMDHNAQEAVIKVIGVGGCGGNAVEHMIDLGVSGVEFIAANTDMQVLRNSRAKVQLQLGAELTRGLGAGGRPEVGRDAAMEDRERISETINGADMLFITAGMGGGTGTGAAPVVAEIARDMGILTVAVITKPFSFENRRMKLAEDGVAELSRYVDSLLVVPNEKLIEVLGGKVPVKEAYRAANGVLHSAVSGIAEIINGEGMINVDFADVRTVMGENGMAMMGSAMHSGENRARIAAEQAVNSPFLENVNLAGARGVLVNITASEETFTMDEFYEVMNTIKSFCAEDASVYIGQVFDSAMGDSLRITLVATGLNAAEVRRQQKPEIRLIQRDGTTNQPIAMGGGAGGESDLAVFTSNGGARRAQIKAMQNSGVEEYDIPAFLRRQAD